MAGIGIVGTGISGLTLALYLQRHGVDVTLYAPQTPGEIRASRLPNTVIRFHPARERERVLGVAHWEFADFGASAIHLSIAGDHPLAFTGHLRHQASGVDFRIYLARLLEDYASWGGRVVVGPVGPDDVARLGTTHELVVVASGRETAGLFPRDPQRSPFTAPQRLLCAGLYRGVALPEPLGVSFNVAPGVGEIFQAPFFSFDGRVSVLLFEAVPGGPMEIIRHLRYDDDPARFEATVLDLLERFAPAVRARVESSRFGLTRPVDLLQGAITPAVRQAWAALPGGGLAMAVGDAWVLNDPITGQGANLGSHSAWTLGQAVVAEAEAGRPHGEGFCRDVERRMWAYAEPVTSFSNAFLLPPAPHVGELLVAAAGDGAVADALVDGFADPPRLWGALATPAGARAFLADVPRSRPAPPAVHAAR